MLWDKIKFKCQILRILQLLPQFNVVIIICPHLDTNILNVVKDLESSFSMKRKTLNKIKITLISNFYRTMFPGKALLPYWTSIVSIKDFRATILLFLVSLFRGRFGTMSMWLTLELRIGVNRNLKTGLIDMNNILWQVDQRFISMII